MTGNRDADIPADGAVVTAPPRESHDRRGAGTPARETTRAEAEAESRETERVITFSDAVVAIAITLLALDLPVPGGVHGLTDGQVLSALRGNGSSYLAFLISFFVIGGQWSSHRSVTRYIRRLNGLVSKLNMTWLLMVVLTPFAARVLSGSGMSGSGGYSARFTIYALIQVIATACLIAMNRGVVRRNLLRRDAPESARHPDNLSYLASCAMFLLSIPLAFVTSWAFVLWAVSPLTAGGLRRIMTVQRPQQDGGAPPWRRERRRWGHPQAEGAGGNPSRPSPDHQNIAG